MDFSTGHGQRAETVAARERLNGVRKKGYGMKTRNLLGAGLFAVVAAGVPAAHAACGSAFCAISTDWDVRGVWAGPGGRAELRYEYIDQDQPRKGRHEVGVGEVPRHHDEVSTVNRNWFATLDYNFTREWGVSVVVPVVDRSHEHIHNHHDEDGEEERIPETWNFTKFGDIRVMGRYTFPASPDAAYAAGVSFGVKLPTGSTDVRNDFGELAERSLQPGTGTTDALFGGFITGGFPGHSDTWFVQAEAGVATNDHDNYRPGNRYLLNAGWRHPFTTAVAGLLQLNFLNKRQDGGLQAEPEDTGGSFLFLSPGVSFAATKDIQLYAYLQLPLYQNVHGVQLTADWAGVLGVATRF